MKDFFMVSGLPRSGSTLLMNIMGQHPDVHVTPTSGCHEILWSTRNTWSSFVEHKADKVASSPKNLQRVLNSILNSYHDTDKNIIIDKHRSWIHSIELLEFVLGKKAKIIVPVRSSCEILSSFEKLYRKNAHLNTPPGNFLGSQTVEGRVQYWASGEGEFGIATNRIKDALSRGLADRLLFVEFDSLTKNPKYTMDKVWEFLEMSPIKHDFNNVEQLTKEDDSTTPYGNLHDIRPIVEPVNDDSLSILGKDICNKFKYSEVWR